MSRRCRRHCHRRRRRSVADVMLTGLLGQFPTEWLQKVQHKKWGTEPATNPVALVSDLGIRKDVFCVLRSGTSATCECEASLPH